MKKLMVVAVGIMFLGLASVANADFVGNKDSKLFFPDNCSYVKLIKKANVVNFKTSDEAIKAGYKASSKCQDTAATVAFVGNKSSKLFFPADCSYVKLMKDDNKVNFKSSDDAVAAGYKASTKCSDKAK